MADFTPIPLDLPTGLYTEGTDLGSRGRFVDGSNVRFWKGKPERIGGWMKYISAQLSGPPRGMIAWRTLAGASYIATGTFDKLYVIDGTDATDITPSGMSAGTEDSGTGSSSAWGMDTWGGGSWGGLGTLATPGTFARTWSLAHWGEDLLAVARDEGHLYTWDASAGLTSNPATEVSGAPTNNLGVLVSEIDRHCILYGAGGDPLLVQWSDAEDFSEWTIDSTTSAGSIRVEDGNEIRGMVTTGLGHLILTDTSAYIMTYVGDPFIFRISKIGSACGLIAPGAVIAVESGAVWMGKDAFYTFDGQVKRVPCDVHSRVFQSLQFSQAIKVACGYNAQYGETTWYFPGTGSSENNSHACLSTEGWSLGNVPRTAYIDANVKTNKPVAASPTGYLYAHESGTTADGDPISYSLKGVGVEIAEGVEFAHVRKIEPDFQRIAGTHTLTLNVHDYPDRLARVQGPYSIDQDTDKLSVRARGKLISLSLSGEDDFRLGVWRAWVGSDGEQP
jgi:hypothetical protein